MDHVFYPFALVPSRSFATNIVVIKGKRIWKVWYAHEDKIILTVFSYRRIQNSTSSIHFETSLSY